MIQIPQEPVLTEYLHSKAARAHIPLSGTFELTPVCNMACKMCYVRMTAAQQQAIAPLHSAEEWLSLARQAKEQGLLYLLLTGGEPLTHPQFREIFTSLHKMGFLVSLNTNGTLIDEKTVEWMAECPPTRVNITLYGSSDETYDRLCGNPHGFTQVMRGIHLLRQAGIQVKLNCSITPYNAHDLERIIAFAKQEQLVLQATSYMFPPLRRDPTMVGCNDRFSPERAAYYAAKSEALLMGAERFCAIEESENPGLPAETEEMCDIPGEKMRCRAGKSSFWVTWEGDLLACGMIPGSGDNNAFTQGFLPTWNRAVARTDSIRLPAKCAGCSQKDTCRACAAMVLTESGCFDKVPQYRCQMSQAYPGARRKVRKELMQDTEENGQ